MNTVEEKEEIRLRASEVTQYALKSRQQNGPGQESRAFGFMKKMAAAFNERLPEPIIRRDADGRLLGGSGTKIRIVYS